MPKIKTVRGAAKRFKITAKGRVKRKQSFRNHILTKMPSKRKRQLRNTTDLHESDVKAVKKMMPYG